MGRRAVPWRPVAVPTSHGGENWCVMETCAGPCTTQGKVRMTSETCKRCGGPWPELDGLVTGDLDPEALDMKQLSSARTSAVHNAHGGRISASVGVTFVCVQYLEAMLLVRDRAQFIFPKLEPAIADKMADMAAKTLESIAASRKRKADDPAGDGDQPAEPVSDPAPDKGDDAPAKRPRKKRKQVKDTAPEERYVSTMALYLVYPEVAADRVERLRRHVARAFSVVGEELVCCTDSKTGDVHIVWAFAKRVKLRRSEFALPAASKEPAVVPTVTPCTPGVSGRKWADKRVAVVLDNYTHVAGALRSPLTQSPPSQPQPAS